MPSDERPSNPTTWREIVAGISMVLGLVAAIFGFIGILLMPTCNADKSASAFFAAVHAGRVDDANALVTPELSPYLRVLSPDCPASLLDSDRGRTLLLVRASRGVDTVGGFTGDFSELCGSVALDNDPGSFIVHTSAFVVLRKVNGKWLVADLGSSTARPDLCEPEPD
jgi:hypothetical protein